MRRRRYLAASGGLAATGVASVRAVRRRLTGRASAVQDETVAVRIDGVTDPVAGGSLLEATVAVENTGSEEVRPSVAGFLEGEEIAVVETTVAAGETETIPFSFRPAPVETDDEVTIRFEAGDDAVERTVAVLAGTELDPERTRPDRELAVQPGTTVLFEVSADALGEFGGETEWFVDGESVGRSLGPWFAAYYGHAGADFWRETFEEAGTYEVRAAVDAGDDRLQATWTVTVADDGTAEPTVEAQRPAEETLAVDEGETVDLEVDVAHPDGGLERVVWWLGHADVVLGESAVSGSEDTAELAFDARCHGCPVLVWVVTDDGVIATEHGWTVERTPDDPAVTVSIVETNDPVDSGSVLEVTVELANETADGITRDLELIVGHDPERVDERSVTVGADDSEAVTLAFTTADVRRTQTFPARVEADDAADEVTVEVIGTDDVGLDVEILETNAPVRTGEFLEVVAEVSNDHDARLSEGVQLVVGHDPDVVEKREVSLEPGASETLAMGYDTAVVARDQEFPVRVEAAGDADEELVFVYVDDPPLLVEILETNDPVDAGDVLEATVAVENPGEDGVERGIEFVVGHDPVLVDLEYVRLAAGERETVTLAFETATVRRTQTFPIRARSDGSEDERTVEVIGTDESRLLVADVETNDPVEAGETLEATVGLEATGTGAVSQEVVLDVGPDQGVDAVTVDIEGGERETVSLSAATTPDDVGEHDLTVRTDDDELTTIVEIVAPAEPASFAVTALDAPDAVTAGEPLAVTATVENVGDESGETDALLDAGDRSAVDSEPVSLEGGQTESVALSAATEPDDIGELAVTVRTDDDERSTTVTVDESDPDEEGEEEPDEEPEPGEEEPDPGEEEPDPGEEPSPPEESEPNDGSGEEEDEPPDGETNDETVVDAEDTDTSNA